MMSGDEMDASATKNQAPGEAARDDAEALDYFKYTLAISVGLIAYLPTQFLPTASALVWWGTLISFVSAVLAAGLGILLYGGIARSLAGQPVPPDQGTLTRRIAIVHLIALVLSLFVAALLFWPKHFLAEVEPERLECQAIAVQQGISPPARVTLLYPCLVEPL